MKKIAFYTIGHVDLPSTRFRILQYLPFLQKEGFAARLFVLPKPPQGKIGQAVGLLWQGIVRWLQLRRASEYDLLIVQKGLTPWRCRGLVKKLLSTGVPYLLDIDDAIYTTNPLQFPFFMRWLQDDKEPLALIRHAQQVIVGNSYLEAFVSKEKDHIALIPTPVDTERYQPHPMPKSPNQKVVIGWSGSNGTNIYFNTLIPILRRLAARHSFELLVMSNSLRTIEVSKLEGVSWRFLEWNKETEVEDLQKIDIGVMPLPDNEWTRGKCGFKALLYMALGLPAVCSPVGVNREIIQDGKNGFLAATEGEWVQKLSSLLENENLRKELGAQARKTVQEKYSLDTHSTPWVNLIEGMIGAGSRARDLRYQIQ